MAVVCPDFLFLCAVSILVLDWREHVQGAKSPASFCHLDVVVDRRSCFPEAENERLWMDSYELWHFGASHMLNELETGGRLVIELYGHPGSQTRNRSNATRIRR